MRSSGATCARWAPREGATRRELSGHGGASGLRGGAGRGGPLFEGRQPALSGGGHSAGHRGAAAPQGKTPRPVEAPVRRGWPGRLSVLGVLWLLPAKLHPLRRPAHPDQPGCGAHPQPHRPGAGAGGAQRGRPEPDCGLRIQRQGPGGRDRGAGGAGHRYGLPLRRGDGVHHGHQRRRRLAGPGGTGGPGGSGGAVRGNHRDPDRPRAGGGTGHRGGDPGGAAQPHAVPHPGPHAGACTGAHAGALRAPCPLCRPGDHGLR